MSAAALALALALFVAPASSRHRVPTRAPGAHPRPRVYPACGHAVVLPLLAAVTLGVATIATPGVAVAVAIVGVTLKVRRRRAVRDRRRAAEAAALRGALDVLVGELRVGAHPVAAFDTAATEADDAVAASLRSVAARGRVGADVAEGIREVGRRSPLPAHWDSLAVCWQLAQTHGLAIATLMKTAQRDIVERERFSARVSAGMAGARTTAGVLAGLPVIGVGLGQMVGANPLGFLLGGGAGDWLLVIGVTLACSGLLWSDRITAGVLR